MIKKKKLLQSLDELIAFEEGVVPFLNKHVPSSLSFSRLAEAEKKVFMTYLQKRSVTQVKHAQVLKDLKNEVEKSQNDVY